MSLKSRALSVLAISLITLSGCATTEGYRQHMNLWYGQHSDELLIDWGAPDEKTTLSDGRSLWIYSQVSTYHGGGYYDHQDVQRRVSYIDKHGDRRTRVVTDSYPVWVPPYTTHSTCNTHFVLNQSLIIREVSFHGSGCVAKELN